jgi:predicted TIM-barrel fold metal-dependent hydrolase
LRIDSHVLYSPGHPPEHLGAILSRNRFDGAMLFGEVLVDLPHILGMVVPIDRLEAWRSHPKLRGVSITLERGIDVAPLENSDLSVDVEMRSDEFVLLERMAARHPERRFVIDHLARPAFAGGISAEWRRGMDSAAGQANVYCKISGLLEGIEPPWSSAPMRPFVQHALARFGPARLMFGSGWPACLPAATWKETLAAFTQSIGPQSMEVREELLGGAAQRFYGINGAGA